MTTDEAAQAFQLTCGRAIQKSIDEGCTVHVAARLDVDVRNSMIPIFTGFYLSDWCDSATLRSYTNGHAH